ncbi:MAG TPA: anti-sigma factor [Pseudonocardiaceae bacterium]
MGSSTGAPNMTGGVEVRLPADLSQLFVLRSVAATLAIRQEFSLDGVEDVKLAVDEMCSALVIRACRGAELICQFAARDGRVDVAVTTLSNADEPISKDTFGWLVLTSLTDSVSSWTAPDPAGGFRLFAVLSVRGGAAGTC